MELTNQALSDLRIYVKNKIAFAQYKVGGTYYQAAIESAEVLSDGRVAVSFVIDHTVAGNITVTEVRLLDHNGNVWASKAVSITRAAAQEGILYIARFFVKEGDE